MSNKNYNIIMDEKLRFLKFTISGVPFCIESKYAIEITKKDKFIDLDNYVNNIIGIICIHNSKFACLNIKKILKFKEEIQGEVIMIIKFMNKQFGILVDDVVCLNEYYPHEIRKLDCNNINESIISGITPDNDIIIDVRSLVF